MGPSVICGKNAGMIVCAVFVLLACLFYKPKKAKKKADPERDMEVFFKDLEEKLKRVMGTKVSINRKDKNKGRIEIEYYSSAELERLIELLESLRQ